MTPKRRLQAETRGELEDSWRARLENALIQHRVASKDFQKALEEQGQELMPGGSHAVRLARQRESDTRAECMRVLRLFSDLVMRDKVPEE